MENIQGALADYQWLANFGFAAIIAIYALTRLEKTIKDMTKQLQLNTIVLARATGQNLDQIKKNFLNGTGGE